MILKQHRKEQFWFWRFLKCFTTGAGLTFGLIALILFIVAIVTTLNVVGDITSLNSGVGQQPVPQGNELEEAKQMMNTVFNSVDGVGKVISLFVSFILMFGFLYLSRVIANLLLGARSYFVDYKKITNSKSILILSLVKYLISIVCAFAIMIAFFVIKDFVQKFLDAVFTPAHDASNQLKRLLAGLDPNDIDQSWFDKHRTDFEKIINGLQQKYENLDFNAIAGPEKLKSIGNSAIAILVFNILLLLNAMILGIITLVVTRKFEPSGDLQQKLEQDKQEKEEKKKAKKEAKEKAKQEKEAAKQAQEAETSEQNTQE